MIETEFTPSKELDSRKIFDIVERSEAIDFHIDLAKKTIKVNNRTDLYKILASFKLITFAENGNHRRILDTDGVPTLFEVSKKVRFINSFEKDSPHYTHPVIAKIGERDEWTILGSISRAHHLPET